jgi:hypothetical protein
MLAELAAGPALGLAPELAGPQELQLVTMVRQFIKARGLRRVVVPIRVPGAAGQAMREGGLLPLTGGPRGAETFDHWLAGRR